VRIGRKHVRSLTHTLMWIALFSISCWLLIWCAWKYHQKQQAQRIQDDQWRIQYLTARNVTPDRLPVAVLSTLLGISEKDSLFSVDSKELCARLYRCSAIKEAKVWRWFPGSIGVEYALRRPVARLLGVLNIGVDRFGSIFFLFPFYSLKRLPKIAVSLKKESDLSALQEQLRAKEDLSLVLSFLAFFRSLGEEYQLELDTIDCVRWNKVNIFQREMVISFRSLPPSIRRVYLRIHPKMMHGILALLPRLFSRLCSDSFSGIIDLRYPNIVLVSYDQLEGG